MNWFLMATLIFLIFFNLIGINKQELSNHTFYKQVYQYSFWGIKQKCRNINYQYSSKKYLIECVVIIVITVVLAYLTMQSIVYCTLLSIIIILVFPYYQYLKISNDYQQLLYNEVLLYASSGILFIQEQKNTMRILIDCADLVKDPLKSKIIEAINYIETTADFEGGLLIIEKQFKQSPIAKLHVLLKSAKSQGGYNINLYRYLYQNIEDIEKNINDYLIRKANNRKIFYIMVLMNIVAAYCFKEIFNITDTGFNQSVFVFYIFNLLTIIYYERCCTKEAEEIGRAHV